MSPENKPFRAIRQHKKSRHGCFTCKRRKVKCDQARPVCGACHLRREHCRFPESSSPAPADHDSEDAASENGLAVVSNKNPILLEQPEARLPATSVADMRMLWFFTANTSQACIPSHLDETGFGAVVQGAVIKEALEYPFLMKTLFALAGTHMLHLGQEGIDRRTMLRLRAEALQGYREAVGRATPEMVQALLSNAILLPAVPTDVFREADQQDLYILDWLTLSHGAKYIIGMFRRLATKFPNGVSGLLIRPPLDVRDMLFLPFCLEQMIGSITADEQDDFASLDIYGEALGWIGALYRSVHEESEGTTVLRVVSWPTLLTDDFLSIARQRRPRALVLLGHFGAFLKLIQGVWWLEGVGDRTIGDIAACVGASWAVEMHIPLRVAVAEDKAAMRRILMEGSTSLQALAWEVSEEITV